MTRTLHIGWASLAFLLLVPLLSGGGCMMGTRVSVDAAGVDSLEAAVDVGNASTFGIVAFFAGLWDVVVMSVGAIVGACLGFVAAVIASVGVGVWAGRRKSVEGILEPPSEELGR